MASIAFFVEGWLGDAAHRATLLDPGLTSLELAVRADGRSRKLILALLGGELTPPTKPGPDGVLVKALARAWRWQSCWTAASVPR